MKFRFTSRIVRMLMVASLVTMVACGDDNEGDTNVIVNPDDEEQQEEQGTYTGQPSIVINNRIDNDVRATSRARVDNDNDQVFVDVDCQQAPPNVVHQQIIHIGVRCPGPGDDSNNDGYVDWQETQQVVGSKLLALDGNLSTQEESGYPRGGRYRYSRSARISELRDILPPGENLNLDGRVLVIYGANPQPLPATFQYDPENPTNISIPITCIVIQKQEGGPTTTGGTVGGGTTTGGTTTGGTTTGGATIGGTTGGTTTGGTTGGTVTTGGTTGI